MSLGPADMLRAHGEHENWEEKEEEGEEEERDTSGPASPTNFVTRPWAVSFAPAWKRGGIDVQRLSANCRGDRSSPGAHTLQNQM